VQRPIAAIVGTVVVVVVVVVDVDTLVVDELDVLGIGAPVENRQPAPGGLNAVMLTKGGGKTFASFDGGVVGVVVVGAPMVVVGSEAAVDEVVWVVVVGAAVGGGSCFSSNPTMMSADTHSPSPTRRGQLGTAP